MAQTDARESRPPDDFLSAAIQVEMKCRQCGYDLRGLTVDSRCPECGLDAWQSVIREIDPATSRLPQLNDPRGAANGLVVLMISLLLAALLLVIGPLARVMVEWSEALVGPLRPLASPGLPFGAGVVSLLGLWSLWKLLPSRLGAGVTTWRDLRLTGIGLLGWALIAMLLGRYPSDEAFTDIRWIVYLALHGFAIVCFVGMGGVFRAVGDRSRAYRRSRSSKQSLTQMTQALVVLAIGQALYGQQFRGTTAEWMRGIGLMLVCVMSFMLIVGLLYLVANAWWIRRSLIRPPRDLATLLTPPPVEDPETDEA